MFNYSADPLYSQLIPWYTMLTAKLPKAAASDALTHVVWEFNTDI